MKLTKQHCRFNKRCSAGFFLRLTYIPFDALPLAVISGNSNPTLQTVSCRRASAERGNRHGPLHEYRQHDGLQGTRREVCTHQGIGLDVCLETSSGLCFVEVKNVTLAG
jgi:hypothetical protein